MNNKVLNNIRTVQTDLKVQNKIFNTLLISLFGIILGVFSKYLDNLILDNSNLWLHIVEKFNLSVFFSLFGKMSWKCKLLVDEEVVYDGKMTLAAIANGICYGGGYYCCPKAKVDDGLIDICLVKKVSILTFAKLVGKYKAGRHLDDEKVMKHLIYKQGKKIQLELSKVLPYSADGEIDYSNNVNIEIVNKCCKFVVPKV